MKNLLLNEIAQVSGSSSGVCVCIGENATCITKIEKKTSYQCISACRATNDYTDPRLLENNDWDLYTVLPLLCENSPEVIQEVREHFKNQKNEL